MIRFWLLALRNLRRNVKRNMATGSAIAFGFAGILLLAGYNYRIENHLRVNTIYMLHTGHVAIFPKGGVENFSIKPQSYSLGPDDQKFIIDYLKSDRDVEMYEAQIRGQGLVGNSCVSLPFMAQGFDAKIDRAVREHPEVKTWLTEVKFMLNGRGLWNYETSLGAILLTPGLTAALGKVHVHDEVKDQKAQLIDCGSPNAKELQGRDANVQLLSGSWQGNLSAVDGEIVGQYTTGIAESDNAAMITSVELLQKLYATDRVQEVAVWLKDARQLKEFTSRLKGKFALNGKEYEVVLWNEDRISPYYSGTMQFLDTAVFAVSIVLASIVSLTVLNSTTMTILERSQEIGMYRSMGFRRSRVRQLYVLESLFLSLASLAMGALLGWLLTNAINSAHFMYHPPGVAGGMSLRLIMNWQSSLKAGVVILTLVLLATFFAVSNRLRIKPADLLGGTLR